MTLMNMTDQELKDEYDHLCKVASEEYEREQKFYAEQVEEFKTLVQKTIDLGMLVMKKPHYVG